ncbi:MAG: DUF1349 domain-containing protein [Bacteroidetes bacterium]|nr:DUF1349 domain-containing protein [Bacteroidota bacterium]
MQHNHSFKNLGLLMLVLLAMHVCHAQTSNWQLLGPIAFPVNISGQINGIGRVCQIKFDPNNANTMYACSASGGFWKSINSGANWTLLGTDMLPKMGTSSCCIDHTNSNIIYLSSGDPNYYGQDLGLWKTTNGGNTWSQINNGIGALMALELLMDPNNNQTLLAATNNGIWKTTDGGANWTQKINGIQCTDMSWQPLANSSIVYASSMNKFYRSTDKGDTWLEITNGFNNLLAGGTRITVSQSNSAVVYVGTVNQEGTIFKSSDTGKNFSIQYNNPLNSLTGYDSTGGGQGNYNFCIEANPLNENQLFLGSHNLWRSNDGGVNWTKLTNWWKELHTDMHDFAFKPGNAYNLFQANDGGVWNTTDTGVNWTPQSDGLGATENYHAAVSPLYAQLISTGTQDNGELVYINNTWKTNRGGDWTTKMQMDYTTQKFVYYFNDLERRALPSGGGNTYAIPPTVTGANILHAFSPDDQNVAYVSGTTLWQTKNLMDATPVWTQIMPTASTIKAVAVVKNHPNILAYSANNRIYISYNALSPSPTFVNYPFPIAITASGIAISSIDTNRIFVILNNKIYQSTDGGVSFTDYSGTLPNTAHKSIYLDDYSTNNSLYVGNTLGVYYRNSTLNDWVNYSGVLPTIASIKDIMYFNDGGVDARLYVAYYGRGTWQTSIENSHSCNTPVMGATNWNGNQLIVNWSNTAASMYQVQYRIIGTLQWITINSNTNNATLNNVAGCNEIEVRVRGNCASDTSLWSNRVIVQSPSNALNADFDGHQDIGGVGAAGSVCYDASNQRYTIYASGEDIWDKQDEFHFLYKKVSGDVTISARVKHIGNIYGWAKGGVMIRESLNTDAKHAICALTPGNGFAMQWRTNTNDWSDNVDTAGTEPGWVKLERIGNALTSYFSTDGNNWMLLNTANITMTDSVYVGLANCSHIDSTINDAVFDHIIINGTALWSQDLVEKKSLINIYPNPAQNALNIRLDEQIAKQNAVITIYDALGHKMQQQAASGQIINTLTINHLPKGVYMLEIVGEQRHVLRFVKQ